MYQQTKTEKKFTIIIAIILAVWASIVILFPAKADQSSVFPPGTLMGVLYVSDGKTMNTVYGGVFFPPNSPVGALYIYENNEMVLRGEITITYFNEASPSPDTSP